MATVLYINGEYCLTTEQLKRFFESQPNYGSPVAVDLLDYARSGDIAEWLREKGEIALADSIDTINKNIGDSNYFSELSNVMTDSHTITEKPAFSECFQIVIMDSEEKDNGILISVQLKVLSSVNEFYELTICTSCDTESKMINPSNYDKETTIRLEFLFSKRIESLPEDAVLLVDNKEQMSISINKTLDFLIEDCTFKMILVKHGSFMMGATEEQEGASYSEKPAHKVTITTDYYIGETPVSQSLWQVVMGSNPSYYKSKNNPVEQIDWYDCQVFIKKINDRLISKLNGKKFRLLTEAEWEFAARGGNISNNTIYSGSNDIEDVAWYYYNSYKNGCHRTHDVMSKCKNELNIYDMSGNVFEWCYDWSSRYTIEHQVNPRGPKDGECRICRGGAYCRDASACSTISRRRAKPEHRDSYTGLRLALSSTKNATATDIATKLAVSLRLALSEIKEAAEKYLYKQ